MENNTPAAYSQKKWILATFAGWIAGVVMIFGGILYQSYTHLFWRSGAGMVTGKTLVKILSSPVTQEQTGE